MFTTISGSFHRHMGAISEAVGAFHDAGVRVLSPADPRVVDEIGPFLFVASDRHRSVRLVQDRHLAAICESNFLWLVCPDGYVGQSAAMEIGFAVARGIPIFSFDFPHDLTLRQYVHRVDTVADAIRTASPRAHLSEQVPSLLIDPSAAVEAGHKVLERLRGLMENGTADRDLAAQVKDEQQELGSLLGLTGHQR